MRVKFGNKIYESEQIIYPGGCGNILYVSYPKGSYEVTCADEQMAKDLFDTAFRDGYVDFNSKNISYDNSWDWNLNKN